MADQDQKQTETVEETVQDTAETTAAAEEAVAAEGEEATSEAAEPTLEETIEQLQADVEAARDSALRAQADAQNVKRRAEQDVEKARKFALERFSGDLLPIVDNLERALEAATEDEAVKPIVEGVELTLKSFLDVLGKNNIEQIDRGGS